MLRALAAVAESQVESASSITPIGVGLIAFSGLMALLFVTYAFRGLSARH